MGSRLWIAHTVHMMLTVLLVDTRPVKTDSKTRAGVITMSAIHLSPSSQIVQAVGRKQSPASASPNEWNLADATRTSTPVEDSPNAWTILDIPTTDKRTWTTVQPGTREQNYPKQNKICEYNMKTPLEMIPKSSPKAPWRTTRKTKTRSTNWCPKTIRNLAVRSPG